MDAELVHGEIAPGLGISTVQVWRLDKEGVLTSRPNVLDRGERLIPVAAREVLVRQGRTRRAQLGARRAVVRA